MTYVLVLDYGYDGRSVDEYETITEVLDRYDRSNGDFEALYEVKREISVYQLQTLRAEAEAEKQAAIEVAKSKLTPTELRLLGLN